MNEADLTEADRVLVEQVRLGEVLVADEGAPPVPADLLQDLAIGRLVDDPEPAAGCDGCHRCLLACRSVPPALRSAGSRRYSRHPVLKVQLGALQATVKAS
jgi:hypothetical protein